MQTLEISKDRLRASWKSASKNEKEMLVDLFGSEVFTDITDRVTSFEDACDVLDLDSDVIDVYPECLSDMDYMPLRDQKSVIAYCKLIIIIRALNEGWEPDWNDRNQHKYWNWWYINSAGLACSTTNSAVSFAPASVGSRLCFKSEELAAYAARTFKDLYEDYLLAA